MGFIVAAWLKKADGRIVPCEVTDTAVRLSEGALPEDEYWVRTRDGREQQVVLPFQVVGERINYGVKEERDEYGDT